jgi:hypothetical protein
VRDVKSGRAAAMLGRNVAWLTGGYVDRWLQGDVAVMVAAGRCRGKRLGLRVTSVTLGTIASAKACSSFARSGHGKRNLLVEQDLELGHTPGSAMRIAAPPQLNTEGRS